jgi:hypothetical protein
MCTAKMAKAMVEDSLMPVQASTAKMANKTHEATGTLRWKTRPRYSHAVTADTTHVAAYDTIDRPAMHRKGRGKV